MPMSVIKANYLLIRKNTVVTSNVRWKVDCIKIDSSTNHGALKVVRDTFYHPRTGEPRGTVFCCIHTAPHTTLPNRTNFYKYTPTYPLFRTLKNSLYSGHLSHILSPFCRILNWTE
ncbi:hypothetical protein ABKN59_003027 [Abortiporus biennis]